MSRRTVAARRRSRSSRNAWNRLVLSLAGDKVTLELNGQADLRANPRADQPALVRPVPLRRRDPGARPQRHLSGQLAPVAAGRPPAPNEVIRADCFGALPARSSSSPKRTMTKAPKPRRGKGGLVKFLLSLLLLSSVAAAVVIKYSRGSPASRAGGRPKLRYLERKVVDTGGFSTVLLALEPGPAPPRSRKCAIPSGKQNLG